MSEQVKVIFGTFAFSMWPKETQDGFVSTLQKYGVKDLDTANIYPGSEKALGDYGAPQKFTIHTKAPGFKPGNLSHDNVIAGGLQSAEHLGIKPVETYFLHSPDPETPIEETLGAIQELYKQGVFKHFGLSNFPAVDVQKIYDHCSSKSYVLPSVYQGVYNPVARHAEAELFPLLRKLHMSFYAYSPIAGGFLVKNIEEIKAGTGRRWDHNAPSGAMHQRLYGKPKLMAALETWDGIAKDAGVPRAQLAYRWVMFNSQLRGLDGDGMIVGASKVSQLEETLEGLKEGPLEESIVKRIEEVWEAVKHEAPIDNYHS